MTPQVVLITGASSGIGAALAREFARQGAKVVLTARRLERLQQLAGEIEAHGGEALALSADVTREADVEAAIARTLERFGRLDVVVANAGFGVAGRIADLGLTDYQRQFETNVFGALRTIKAALPALRRSHGLLVLIGSVTGYVGLPGMSAYSASKFALRGLADSLRLELATDGIGVTHVAPSFVTSEIRQVDNRGQWHAHAPDPVPSWLRMDVEPAARLIVRAVRRRQAELVFPFNGKAIVWFARHTPWLVRALMRALRFQARREPTMTRKDDP